MSKILDEVLKANEQYSQGFGERGKLALPPARGFAILTCMDARPGPQRSMPDWRRAMPMSFAMQEDVRAMTPSDPWSSATNCWARGSSS